MLGGHVVDQLLDQHGLADTGTAEQADLAALGVGSQQVDDLDAGLQNFSCRFLLRKAGGLAVDGPVGQIVRRFIDVLRHLHGALSALCGHGQRFLQGRQLAPGEFDIHHGARYSNNSSLYHTIASLFLLQPSQSHFVRQLPQRGSQHICQAAIC